jgi:hypothetical protein
MGSCQTSRILVGSQNSCGSDSGVDIKNNDGDTSLHLVFQGINTCSREVALIKTSMAKLLIHAYADPILPNNAGVLPVDMITVELAQELGLPYLSQKTPFFKALISLSHTKC